MADPSVPPTEDPALKPAGDETSAGVPALPDEPGARVAQMAEQVAEALDLRATVELTETDEEIRVVIDGEELGLLIGKHGNTIDALQHLCGRAAFVKGGERKDVVVDAAGYRERREASLRRAADQAVDDALSFGRPVELEPMSAAERKIVHHYLADIGKVDTHSEGDEPERRLVVSPLAPAG